MSENFCPVCGLVNNVLTVSRNDLITMQNYIYQNYSAALNAQTGQFELYNCRNCGFAYNAAFDSSLMRYDENYDNQVSSGVFADYYKEVASFLYNKFSLENGLIIDVGCGKGTFLNTLCKMYPSVKGLGIDPSFEPNNSCQSMPNLKFIQDIFKEEYITQKPSLIICRHVLEHIEHPAPFLKSIHGASHAFAGTPFFIEVPDLEWIVENDAFWDFCYEHCNYFTADSLKNALRLSGFKVENIKKAFQGQYLWSFGTIVQDKLEFTENDSISNRLVAYTLNENNLISTIKGKLKDLKSEGNALAVWGMATKGVVFCNLIDPEKELFDYCIDIYQKKIGCFVPHTGHRISAPETLREAGSSKLMVVVMNPNYLSEINKNCKNLNLNPRFIDANGNDLFAE